jgi:hypothetical protein
MQQIHQKFSTMVPVIRDLYDIWLEKKKEKLDIIEDCNALLQMFDKISAKELLANRSPTARWNVQPRSKDIHKDINKDKEAPLAAVTQRETGIAILGDKRLKKEESCALETVAEDPIPLSSDEKERLRIFSQRTKKSRDQLREDKVDENRVSRLKDSIKQATARVDVKVYINDLKYRVIKLEGNHSKNDLCQLAINAFHLDNSIPYTISLWRDFKLNREIKEIGDPSPYKLYYNVVANDPSNIFHIHRVRPPKSQPAKVQLGPNMEDWNVPKDKEVVRFKRPKIEESKSNRSSKAKKSSSCIA